MWFCDILVLLYAHDHAVSKLPSSDCAATPASNALQLQVLDNEICFKWSEYENIFELFHARSNMHRRVYTHR